jgi:DNA polymerase
LSSPSGEGALTELAEQADRCRACALHARRRSVVFGEGPSDARLVMLGEGPGASEDEQGRPFVGRSGQLLITLLAEELGLARQQVYLTSVVKCRPPENREPSAVEIASCRGFLVHQLELLDPAVVVTLGNVATRALLDTRQGITVLRGTLQRSELCKAIVVPTFHPAAGLRGGAAVVSAMRHDLRLAGSLLEETPA